MIVPKSSLKNGQWQFCKLLDALMMILGKIVVKTLNIMIVFVKTITNKWTLKTVLENCRHIQSKN